MNPSTHLGMGAIIFEGGVTFRVWAPHAQKVAVLGDFNNFSTEATPLAPEGNGYWSVDVSGAQVGHRYQYAITCGGETRLRNDPRSLIVSKNEKHSLITTLNFEWDDQDFALAPRDELVIYEMHIGTFHRHDPVVPGTFAGAQEKLDFLAKLGVNAIEVMPITEFTSDTSWGYNPAYPFAVESSYGGAHAFQEFVNAAHKKGIGVILDVVYNHLGPGEFPMWQFDDWSNPNSGGSYFYPDDRASTPWGDTRLNYTHEAIRHFINDNIHMWFEKYHVDGLRWDSTFYLRNKDGKNNYPGSDLPESWSLLQEANNTAHNWQPAKFTIAEDLQNEWALTADTQSGGAGFNAQWDPAFELNLRDTIQKMPPTLDALEALLKTHYNNDPLQRVMYIESHDADANGRARFVQELAPDRHGEDPVAASQILLALSILFTAPGIPMIFQGQESLQDGWFGDMSPMDWAKVRRFGDFIEKTKRLITLRRSNPGLRGPNIAILSRDDGAKTLAYHRWRHGAGKDDVVVCVNIGNKPQRIQTQVPFDGRWRCLFASFDDVPQAVEVTAKQLAFDLPPHGAIILTATSV